MSPPMISRRDFLATGATLAGSAAVGATVTGCATERTLAPIPESPPAQAVGAPPASGDLAEPLRIVSAGGVLNATLALATAPVRVGGRVAKEPVTIGGSFPAPTLEVRPGDWLDLLFVNRINFDQASDGRRGRYRPPRDGAMTNIHYHGLHVPPTSTPQGAGDDMAVMIPRGASQRYLFRIPPTHPAGLFFYHPHIHGLVTNQQGRGAAGLLYVSNGHSDEVARRGITRRLMMLQQAYFDEDESRLVSDDGERDDPQLALSLINGQLQPDIRMRPREPQVWALCNGSTSAFYMLELDGHTFDVVAEDGLPLPFARTGVSRVLLTPGNRVELVVRGQPARGRYALRLAEFNQGVDTWPAKVLATVEIAGLTWTGAEYPGPDSSALLPDLSGAAVAARRSIVFGVNESVPEGEFGRFTMNGHSWGQDGQGNPDPDYVEWTSTVGTVEEWVISNETSQDHPFHVHTNPFQVVRVTGAPSYATLGYADTVVVPRNGGTVTVRTRFDDFPGRILMHCHILDHEDMGMMTSFVIAPAL